MSEDSETKEITPTMTPEQKKEHEAKIEMLLFVGLDIADGNTRYINIEYPAARTCIVMGTWGIHCRMTGEQKGKFWNENLAIHVEEERQHDMCMSCKRSHVFSVTSIRKKMDWSQSDMSEEERAKQPEYLWNLVIKYDEGDIALTGLPEATALTYKKMIWQWINFHNGAVQQNNG